MDARLILRSPLLEVLPGVRHAFFTRRGGVSRGVYASLNVGQGSHDAPAAVAENRRRAAAALGVADGALLTAYQIHSPTPVVVTEPWVGERPRADAVVTATPGLLCGALAADCAPVLLADPRAGVVAAVHAGWRGALGGVVEAAVEAMRGLGARPGDMLAAIGPCIAQVSYEVGLDFMQRFEAEISDAARFFAPGASRDKRQFDLPGFVGARLADAGVSEFAWIGRDTAAEEDDFFSNRRTQLRGEGDYGRLLSAIMIAPRA